MNRANRASAGCEWRLPARQDLPCCWPEQQAAIGQQGGGRVFLFLETDDFWGDYQRMQAYGVHFCEQPRSEPYGMVVVFEDISGNRWDLLQLAAAK